MFLFPAWELAWNGAGNWIRTSDLLITNQLLYQLSYASILIKIFNMERETGLEPATYSLEGCRSSQLSYSRELWWGEQDSNL